jgi:hypothetical protein
LRFSFAGELFPAVKAVLEGKRFISASLAGHFLVATAGLLLKQRFSRQWLCSFQEFANDFRVLFSRNSINDDARYEPCCDYQRMACPPIVRSGGS